MELRRLEMWQVWKTFRTVDVTLPQYLRTAPLKQLAWATRAPGGGTAPEDWGGGRGELQPEHLLRLGILLKKQWMSINLLRPESVKEIEPAEYAENTEKSGNTIGVSVISIFTFHFSLWRVMLKKIWILVHCVEGNSYPGTTQRYTIKKKTWKNPYHCTMCGKGLISRNHTKRHMKSLARENLYQCVLCGKTIVET